jgi:PKD repeat protein
VPPSTDDPRALRRGTGAAVPYAPVPATGLLGRCSRIVALAVGVAVVAFAGLAVTADPVAAAETLTVTNLPIASLAEGQPFSGPIATVVDSGGANLAGEYSATIAWGDGVQQSAVVTVSGEEITILAFTAHTYAEEGVQTLTVTVKDEAEHVEGSDATTIAVSDAPLSAPFAAPSVFSGAGPATANALGSFEAGIGGANNGATPGGQPHGFRRIDWDGVKLDGTQPAAITIAPGHAVAIPVDTQQERGVELDSPIAVSGDGFASVNPGVAGLFSPFSAANIVAPFDTNAFALDIVTPAPPGSAPVPALTSGLGVTFLNVELPNTTSVEYLNGKTVLAKVFAPAGGHDQPSFVGALFGSPVITSIVVTLGTARIFNFDGTTFSAGPVTDGGQNNLVAADDVVLAEPAREGLVLSATGGVPFSGTLATFQDGDPNANSHDYGATVDWGDGGTTQGLIAPDPGGGFTVSGAHSYAQAGTLPVSVTVRDFGGASQTFHDTIAVAPASVAPITQLLTIAQPAIAPPHCTLSTVRSATLARLRDAHSASVAHRKSVARSHLRVGVSCDESAAVTLTATATLASAGRKAHRTATTRSVARMLALGHTSASVTANHPATLSIALTASTLVRLKAAVTQHRRISVGLTLTVTNAHGSSAVSATLANLKL